MSENARARWQALNFLQLRAAFARHHVQPVEPGRDALFERRIRQEIADVEGGNLKSDGFYPNARSGQGTLEQGYVDTEFGRLRRAVLEVEVDDQRRCERRDERRDEEQQ